MALGATRTRIEFSHHGVRVTLLPTGVAPPVVARSRAAAVQARIMGPRGRGAGRVNRKSGHCVTATEGLPLARPADCVRR